MKKKIALVLALGVLAGCAQPTPTSQPESTTPVTAGETQSESAASDISPPEDAQSEPPGENRRVQHTEERTDYIVDCPFPQGDGWYLLQSAADLRLLRELVDAQATFTDGTKAKNGKYRLTQDVDLSDELHPALGWIPIGSYQSAQRRTSHQWTSFSGEFDGGMHTVTGLVINAPGVREPQGLFGHVSNGVIRNVVIRDCEITALDSAGAVAGKVIASNDKMQAYVADCYATGTIRGSSFLGGIVGDTHTATRCGFSGDVIGAHDTQFDQTSYAVGGVAGETVLVQNCFARGSVSGYRYAGGVVGGSRRVFDSYYIGTLSGIETVGGIVGSAAVVERCYTVADVLGCEGVGGVVGHIATTYNTEPEPIDAVARNLLAAGGSVTQIEAPSDREHSFDWPVGRVMGFVGAGIGADNLYGLETMDTDTVGRGLEYYWDGDNFPAKYLTDPTAWAEVLAPTGEWDDTWKITPGCYPQLVWESGDAMRIPDYAGY